MTNFCRRVALSAFASLLTPALLTPSMASAMGAGQVGGGIVIPISGGSGDYPRERISRHEAATFRPLAELLPAQRQLLQRLLPQTSTEAGYQAWAADNDALAATFLAVTQALARTEVEIKSPSGGARRKRPALDFILELKVLEGDHLRATLDHVLFAAWRAEPRFRIVFPNGKKEEGKATFKEGHSFGCSSLHEGYEVQAYTSCANVPRLQINYRATDHEADIDLDGFKPFVGIFPNARHLTFDNSDVRMWRDVYVAKFGDPGFAMRPNSAIGGSPLGSRVTKLLALLSKSAPPASATARTYVAARTVVFAEGFVNEWVPKYFADNEQALRQDLGLVAAFHLQYASDNHIRVNAASYARDLRRRYRDGGNRPIIVLAHSKGAAEVLLALMREPALLRDGVVDRLVSIQGSILGTPIADLAAVCSTAPPPPTPGQFGPPPGCMVNYGLLSLQSEEARRVFREAVAQLTPDDRALLAGRVDWVRSFSAFTPTTPMLKPTELALNRYGGNDGMLVTADQRLTEIAPDIGRDLGILDADHTDLTCPSPMSNQPAAYRRAFTLALFEELAGSAP